MAESFPNVTQDFKVQIQELLSPEPGMDTQKYTYTHNCKHQRGRI